MRQSHAKSNIINHPHERYRRIIYNDKIFTFNKLMEKDISFFIQTGNLRFLAVEMFKVKVNF